uniref:AMP-dependent synthetase/ligase domain-containing protein n=1 Tax=Oryza punctata TaxID=4537 RepID=A0A0E0K727_ORYPU
MEEILESTYPAVAGGGDAASFVLSRLPHPDTTAFVDATGAGGGRTTLSFVALHRAALSLASGLRFGLGLRRGDAVLVLSPNSLLLPPIVLGVLAAGGVVVAADPGSAAEEVAAMARSSGAVIVVAAPEVAEKVAGAGVPLLLTSRSMDPRALSAEELMDDGDPTALASPEEAAAAMPRPSDVAFVFYSSATTKTAATMTHADLIAAVASASSSPDERRVCLASLPICSVHGLPLLALALPAAGVTTVLLASPSSDPTVARVAAAAHGATDVVATPDVAAALAAPVALQGKMLAALRRVTVVPALATTEARQAFRRWLPWVELTEMSGSPEKRMASVSEQVQVMPDAARAAVMEYEYTLTEDFITSPQPMNTLHFCEILYIKVPLLKKIQKTVLGDILSKSTANKILREHPEIISKL